VGKPRIQRRFREGADEEGSPPKPRGPPAVPCPHPRPAPLGGCRPLPTLARYRLFAPCSGCAPFGLPGWRARLPAPPALLLHANSASTRRPPRSPRVNALHLAAFVTRHRPPGSVQPLQLQRPKHRVARSVGGVGRGHHGPGANCPGTRPGQELGCRKRFCPQLWAQARPARRCPVLTRPARGSVGSPSLCAFPLEDGEACNSVAQRWASAVLAL
jgi:hypothetical protein